MYETDRIHKFLSMLRGTSKNPKSSKQIKESNTDDAYEHFKCPKCSREIYLSSSRATIDKGKIFCSRCSNDFDKVYYSSLGHVKYRDIPEGYDIYE